MAFLHAIIEAQSVAEYLETSALASCVKVWILTVIATIWSVRVGSVLCCLNHHLRCNRGQGATS
jgi:hypothetical protein